MQGSSPPFQTALVAGLVATLALSLISPVYPREQWLQHTPTLIGLAGMYFAARRRWLSNAAASCVASILLLHIVGARWIYTYVPYDRWMDCVFGSSPDDWFHGRRNHYDRAVHFAFGGLMVLPLAEAALYHHGIGKRWALSFAVLMIAAASACYEVFEWVLAVIAAPEIADRYNGQQGDMWDSQKDMALAIGASLAAAALLWRCDLRRASGISRPTSSAPLSGP